MKLSIFALMLAIVSLGCVSQVSFPIVGSHVIDISRIEQSPGLNDIVVLENVRMLPETQALPEQTVRFFANAVSKEQDPARVVDDVYLEIFDATQFRTADGSSLCNNAISSCQPEDCNSGNKCILRAGETKAMEVVMTAPTVQDIANVKTPVSVNYRLVYDHTSTTNFEVVVVSEDEILRLQQEGKKLAQEVRHVSNAGPLQLVLETADSGSFGVPGQVMFVRLKIANRGGGSPKNIEIPASGVTLAFPGGLGRIEAPDEFGGSISTMFRNTKEIKLIKGESIPYQFRITPNDLGSGVPHRTYLITAQADYTYEMRGSHSIDVLPR